MLFDLNVVPMLYDYLTMTFLIDNDMILTRKTIGQTRMFVASL